MCKLDNKYNKIARGSFVYSNDILEDLSVDILKMPKINEYTQFIVIVDRFS
jgi:hypothetical protein